jgi:thymidylate kinase
VASVALIGPDGAGKTTLTRMLAQSGLLPLKCIYMGIDISASNVSLPTSRLVARLKKDRARAAQGANATTPPAGASGRRRGVRHALWATARLANRLADEWYRQAVSWWHQYRGFTVLYDRHFAFDFSHEVSGNGVEPIDRRVHRWCLEHLYPRPDLVVFLDAPGETLFARKGELTPRELERRRQAFLNIGRRVPAFVRVDATRPIAEVYSEVAGHVLRAAGRRARRAAAGEAAR